jgi:hypothetical protein
MARHFYNGQRLLTFNCLGSHEVCHVGERINFLKKKGELTEAATRPHDVTLEPGPKAPVARPLRLA